MKVTPLNIPDVLLIEHRVFEDARGFFFESFREDVFKKETSLNISFVQDNHSKSSKGVLRGLHYQEAPFAQGKLIRVIVGEVFDVVVDIRKESRTYGKWVSEVLSAENKKQLWIPEGFAHGFLTLSDQAEILYKTTNFYNKSSDRSIRFDDIKLSISWPKIDYFLSKKDQDASTF